MAEAKADGRYTTEDGYIFDPMDVADPQTQLTQDGYRIPLANGSGYRLVLKRNLNYFRELLPAESQAAKKDLSTSAPQPAPSLPSTPSTPTPTEKAQDIYERVPAEARIPFDQLPYQLGYVDRIVSGRMVVPHGNHNHYYAFYSFDEGHYHAPAGYSLEDLFATVKYYMEHPQERPLSTDGWGRTSEGASADQK